MTPDQNHGTMQVHVAQWQVSSLSQAKYCKEHGIKPHIFNYYKKKFSSSVKQSSQLVPVTLLADEALSATESSARNVLRLTHTNGFSLEINPHTDMAFLRPLLELLRSVS